MSLQSCKIIIWKLLGLPLGSLKNFNHFNVAFLLITSYSIERKVVFPPKGMGHVNQNNFGLPMIKS
jgi:hypothetical protein